MQVAREASSRPATARLGSLASAHPYVIVMALTLLAGGLGFLRLEYRAVHFDEAISIGYAHESWVSLLHSVTGEDPNMSLYHALLKIWTGVFGSSLLAVRSLSVVAAILCVPVVYAIGVRLFGVAAGLLAALLISTNVFFLRYAQEARGYALVTLLTVLSTYFFLVEAGRPSRWSRVGYVASSALAFYAHFFAVWVVLIHVVTLVAAKRREALRSSWLVCYGVMAALAAPMAYWALTLGGDPIGWLAKPDWGAIPATFAQLAGDSFLHLGAVVAFCMLAVRWAPRSTRLAFGLAFTAAWAVLPVLAAFALSQVKPVFLAKYLIVSLPAILLLAAGAVASLRPVGAALAAACILVALSGPELRTWYGFHGNEDWRSLTSFVLDRARPADAIIFNARYARDSVEDYSRSSKSPAPGRFPTTASPSSAAARTRVWLALAHSQRTTEALRSALMRHHRLEARQVFNGDIAVELYVRRKS